MGMDNTYKILQRLVDFTVPKEHRRTVREWLIDDKDRKEKEEALYQIWSDTLSKQEISIEEPLKNTWEKIGKSERKFNRRLFIKRVLRYVAIILLPIISGVTVWKLSEKSYFVPEMIECYVPNGEQRTLTLPDGSLIHINAGSLLIYPSQFTASKRQVYLSGEANFFVESNPEKPFIVRTGELNVEALGTKFNIESYPGSGVITTTLEHGSVKIYKEEKPENAILMKPYEQVCFFVNENRFVTNLVESSDYSAWTKGELRFINKSLDVILFTLERKYDVRFLVDTKIKGSDLYTMKFKAHETIDDALYVLSEILGSITYHKEGQTVRINVKSKEVPR
ncbi:MAG: FecR domain-containing protein [Prevotella sp.]|jgi:ferric-dicitrate binding protein FerR (iron transport regulator)|nr:FecR domain-containing protein [Prevotella sp.]